MFSMFVKASNVVSTPAIALNVGVHNTGEATARFRVSLRYPQMRAQATPVTVSSVPGASGTAVLSILGVSPIVTPGMEFVLDIDSRDNPTVYDDRSIIVGADLVLRDLN